MERKYALLIITIFPLFAFCQKDIIRCEIPLDFPGLLYDSFEVNKTYVIGGGGSFGYNLNLSTSDTIKFKMTDCFGSCSIVAIDKNKHIILKGTYCGDGKLTKSYVNIFDNKGTITGKRDLEWYEPKKCGVWIFYDSKGKIEKEEKY